MLPFQLMVVNTKTHGYSENKQQIRGLPVKRYLSSPLKSRNIEEEGVKTITKLKMGIRAAQSHLLSTNVAITNT